jgi:hypothetical protein
MSTLTRSWILGAMAVLATSAMALAGCSSSGEGSDDEESAADAVTEKPKLELTDDQRREIVSKKATCPFVGTALALKKIFVFGSVKDPVAKIADGPGNIRAVGNLGGGDLGEGFRIVARANHHMSPSGEESPNGMFSLAFPASTGAHAAHSFILMGDPKSPTSGRLNAANLGRLINLKSAGGHAELAPNGSLVVRRSELGRFVARNVACDPNAVTASSRPFALSTLLGSDIIDFNRRAFAVIALKLERRDSSTEVTKLLEDMVQIAVGNNLVGGVGELGLLMTFLGPSGESVTMRDGEPALAVSDIEGIFAGVKKDGKYDPLTRHFPTNSDTTAKTIPDFLKHTIHILKSASASHLTREFRNDANCPNTR